MNILSYSVNDENQIKNERMKTMCFSQRLNKAMVEQNITQADLSAMTGIGRSGISQYCSGKNKPGQRSLKVIADALNVQEAWLRGTFEEENVAVSNFINLPIATAAKLMGVSKQFIRVGLQSGWLPFGCAVNVSGKRFSYYINPKKFAEYTGISVEEKRI